MAMDLSATLKIFDLEPNDLPMIALGAVMVLVLINLLKGSLFKPYLALIEAREAATSGAQNAAEATLKEARAKNDEYSSKLMSGRVAAMQKKLARVSEARAQAAKVVESAESEAQEIVRKVRWDLGQQVDSLRATSFKEAEAMAATISAKLQAGNGSGAR